MYESHSKRMALLRVADLRNSMIAGVWGNPNFDEGDNTREQLLGKIDSFYDSSVAAIYGTEEIESDTENDPFFAAMKRPQLLIDKESVQGVNRE